MRILEIIIGILISPFVWIYDRLLNRNPSSPPEFWLFIGELRKRGVIAKLQMQKLSIEGISRSAIVVLEPNTSTLNVASLFKCDSVETANRILADLESNPGMSHCKRRDRYLMSLTLVVPNDQLAEKVTEGFGAFELPPVPDSY